MNTEDAEKRLGPNQRRVLNYLRTHKKATYKELGKLIYGEELTTYGDKDSFQKYRSLYQTLQTLIERGLVKKKKVSLTEYSAA